MSERKWMWVNVACLIVAGSAMAIIGLGKGLHLDGGWWTFGTSSNGGGGSATVVDDFEYSNVGDYYSGDTGSASLVTSPVQNGSQALELGTGASTKRITRDDTIDGHELTRRGYEYEYYFQVSDSVVKWFLFARSASTDWYAIEYDHGNSRTRLMINQGGTTSELASQSLSLSTGVWHKVNLEYKSNGDIIVSINGNVQINVQDSTHAGGGIGWEAGYGGGGMTIYADYVREVSSL